MLVWLAAGATMAGPIHERIEIELAPGWVDEVEVALDGPAANRDDAGAVSYLLVDRQFRLPVSGPAATYRRVVYRIESRAALEDWSSRRVEFEPSYQRVVLHKIGLYRDDRWHDRLDRSRYDVIQREADLDRRIFDQRLSLLIVLEDVRVGDVVEMSHSVIGTNPVMRRASGGFSLGWGIPVARQRTRFLVHRSRELRFKSFGIDLSPETRRRDELVETVWQQRDVPAYDIEPNLPHDCYAYPWLQYTEYRSWEQVANWALPLYESVQDGSPRLQPIARELLAQSDDPREQVRLARNWVQDEVRYFAIVIGEHSHAPHRPDEILGRRYGDCKDKSTLLISLLRAMGFEAWPAFVHGSRRETIESWLPAPGAFTHVIVVARTPYHTIWIDPTLRLQGGHGFDAYLPPYGAALEIRRGTMELTGITESASDPGSARILYSYEVDDDLGRSRVTIISECSRHEAEKMRARIAGTTTSELLEQYIDYYTSDDLTVRAADRLDVRDNRAGNLLAVTEEYWLERGPTPDKLEIFEALPLEIASTLSVPGGTRRDLPLALPYPHHRVEMIRLDVDPDVGLEPINDLVESPWFRFKAMSERTEDGILITYWLDTLRGRVEPSELAEYADQVSRMQESLGYTIQEGLMGGPELRRFALGTVALPPDASCWRGWPRWEHGSSSERSPGLPGARSPHGGGDCPADRAVRDAARIGVVGIVFMGGLLETPTGSWWEAYDVITLLIVVLRWIALLFGAGAFIAWQRSMTKNLPRLGAWSLDPGVGWTTWCWFVPFANLFYPCRSMLQIAQHSRPSEGRGSKALIGLWWGSWILSGLITYTASVWVRAAGKPRTWIAGSGGELAGNAALMLAGVLAVGLLIRLTRQQETKLASTVSPAS